MVEIHAGRNFKIVLTVGLCRLFKFQFHSKDMRHFGLVYDVEIMGEADFEGKCTIVTTRPKIRKQCK